MLVNQLEEVSRDVKRAEEENNLTAKKKMLLENVNCVGKFKELLSEMVSSYFAQSDENGQTDIDNSVFAGVASLSIAPFAEELKKKPMFYTI